MSKFNDFEITAKLIRNQIKLQASSQDTFSKIQKVLEAKDIPFIHSHLEKTTF